MCRRGACPLATLAVVGDHKAMVVGPIAYNAGWLHGPQGGHGRPNRQQGGGGRPNRLQRMDHNAVVVGPIAHGVLKIRNHPCLSLSPFFPAVCVVSVFEHD
jgi:hypothetical protein